MRLAVLGLVCSSCLRAGAFHCETNADCKRGAQTGTCEAVGYCSFPDDTCSGGSRFSTLSGPYSNECVEAAGSSAVGDVGVDVPTSGLIQCDTTTCRVGSEVCCAGSAPTCAAMPMQCTGGSTPCDDRTDCALLGHPGTICCLETKTSGDGIKSASCRPLAMCIEAPLILCAPGQPDPCPDGGTCQPVVSPATLSFLYQCR